jgi:hypothetical protein
MSALSELDPANRGSTMYMRDRFDQSDARRAAAEEEQRRQAMMQKYTDGLSPEMAQLAQLAPDKFLESRMEQAFAQPDGPEYQFMNIDGVGYRGDKRAGTLEAMTERGGPETPWYITDQGVDPRYVEAQNARQPNTVVHNNMGGKGGYNSLSDVPIGEFVPPDLIKGIDVPPDQYARRTNTMPGFEFVPIPGSSTQRKNETREEGLTIGTLIGDYADLDKNKAIRSRDNSFEDNLRGVVATSPPGRFWDSTVGNIENHEARDSIEGLSMNALMQMISMSDVSAKAMDSDAEMRAWLGAIKGDTFESALTKLHVLDTSFGSGNELKKAWQNGVIDEATYRYVTNRVSEDPFTAEMAARAQRYASLGGAIGTERMTQNELGSANDLLEYMSPEERALFEGSN